MKNEYSAEDMEALLADKSFSQLYEEERSFVLEHLSSAAEYERMRETLLAIRGAGGETIGSVENHPSARVKKDLMSRFEEEKKRRMLAWWYGIGFRLRDLLFLDIPAMRIGYVTVILLAGWFGFSQFGNQEEPVGNNPVSAVPQTIRSMPEENKSAGKTDAVVAKAPVQTGSNPDGIISFNDGAAQADFSSTPVAANTLSPDSSVAGTTLAMTNSSDSVTAICCGSSVFMNSPPGATYSWTPSNSGNVVNSTNSASGVYTVTIQSSNAIHPSVEKKVVVPRTKSLKKDSAAVKLFFKVE
jgi:hypothetical protein